MTSMKFNALFQASKHMDDPEGLWMRFPNSLDGDIIIHLMSGTEKLFGWFVQEYPDAKRMLETDLTARMVYDKDYPVC